MKIRRNSVVQIIAALFVAGYIPLAAAGDDDDKPTTTNSWTAQNARYGLFDGLDHRSAYTQDVFTEPFIIDDMALEDNELELSWGHSKSRTRTADSGSTEYQKGFGLLTVEAEISYQNLVTPHGVVQGLGPLELGARYPLYQFVSDNRMIDITLGPGLESSIPLQLRINNDTELEPLGFCALRLGEYFTAQTVFGYDMVFGGGNNGGERSYEFGTSLAYTIPHQDLPLPGTRAFIPMVELSNELGLNSDENGKNNLQGDIGFRIQLKPIGEMNSNIGFAYVFPLDTPARQDLHWGMIVSLIFDF